MPDAEATADDDTPNSKAPTRTAQINRGVNMRTRPESGSGVLTVVPKAANVELVGCEVWCEVVYKGRRGYVFKDFVGSRARAPVLPKSGTKTTSAKKTATAKETVTTKEIKTARTLRTSGNRRGGSLTSRPAGSHNRNDRLHPEIPNCSRHSPSVSEPAAETPCLPW